MPMLAGQRYTGYVTGGGWATTQNGTPYFQIVIECEDWKTTYQIWLTDSDKAKASARKAFLALGVTDANLTDVDYMERQLPQDIVGTEICFGTAEDTYKGKTSVKVRWIGKPSASADKSPAAAAAVYFGGTPDSSDKTTEGDLKDDDIPF